MCNLMYSTSRPPTVKKPQKSNYSLLDPIILPVFLPLSNSGTLNTTLHKTVRSGWQLTKNADDK